MKKLNTKGFSAIEGLLILLMVVVICAVGWFVYKNHNKTTTTQVASTTPTTNPKTSDSPTNIQKYDDSNYSFNYPLKWTTSPSPEKGSVLLKSSDYGEKQIQAERGPYSVISTGYSLEVEDISGNDISGNDISGNESYKTIADLTSKVVQDEKDLGGGTHKTVTVDGSKAIWVNNKFDDNYLYVVVFKGNKIIHIQLNAPDDTKPAVSTLFDSILNSFVIK